MTPSHSQPILSPNTLSGEPAGMQNGAAQTVLASGDESASVNWEEVHALVQVKLANLAESVARQLPEVRAQFGRTSAPSIHLFSYVQFDWPANEALVGLGAGVYFGKTSSGEVIVRADIVRDEEGDIVFEGPTQRVRNERSAILPAAAAAAQLLSGQGLLLQKALQVGPQDETTASALLGAGAGSRVP